ncbi:MAG: transglutaminase-like cysteine peptidase [Kiloniellales bacterium]
MLSFLVTLSQPAWALQVGEPRPATGSATISGGHFDSETRRAFPKWSGVIDRVAAWPEAGTPSPASSGGAKVGLREWFDFLASLQVERPAALLRRVNAYVNGVRYVTDSDNWGKLDYWATPDEFFERGGDCEDFAIAKYFSLKMIGFPADQMRIVVLNDRRLRIAHAVLEVRIDDQTFVLDNRYGKVMSWDEVPHYRAIYSVNEATYWVHSGERPSTTWELPATAAGSADE